MPARHEEKYLIDYSQYVRIRARAEAAMLPDPHGDFGSYLITSLYYDDANDTALLEKLAQLDSVKKDDRDLMYVTSYLPQMLAQSEQKTAGAAYNQAAADFNGRMNKTFSGWLARTMLGIKPAAEFIAK